MEKSHLSELINKFKFIAFTLAHEWFGFCLYSNRSGREVKRSEKKTSYSLCLAENELNITINHRTILTNRLNIAEADN